MIIVPLPKLGADEIAYINPTSGLQGVSRDPNSCIVTKLMFSSSHGLDSMWYHANQAVLSCLLKEINEKEAAEFPGEWGWAFSCLAARIIHPPPITHGNTCA